MYQSISRATASFSLIPQTLRSARQTAPRTKAAYACLRKQQSTATHTISNPTLAGIEKRWERMPPSEQAELWMQLRDRMTNDWQTLTLQEKKACVYMSRLPFIMADLLQHIISHSGITVHVHYLPLARITGFFSIQWFGLEYLAFCSYFFVVELEEQTFR